MKRLLLLALVLASSAWATPAFVRGTTCTSSVNSTTQTCSLASVASGDTVMAFFHWDDSAGAANGATLTISASGITCTMAQAFAKFRSGTEPPAIQGAYCAASSSGTVTVTGTFNHSSNYTEILVAEYSAVGTLDKVSTNGAASGTACTSGATAALTQTGDLAIGLCTGWNNGQTWGTVSGWTNRASASIPTYGLYDQVEAGTTAVTFSKTLTAGDTWDSAVMTFAPGAGGGTTVTPKLTLLGVGP